ncbi:MAG TPA: DUF4479 domain-containing protein [Bacillales bacterium]|nr:DUF4479 domain-containing protein [Bacillales bacterium]
MNIFYNKKGVGDTLLVRIADADRDNIEVEKKGDAARIYDKISGKTAGYNLFGFSKYGVVNDSGIVKNNEALVKDINDALEANGFEERLTFDGRPDFVVGFVKEKRPHPDADKLSVCQVDLGSETVQIVCGAPNVDAGQKVVVATTGAVMPSGTIIRDAELRGVESKGMICSAKELNLPDAPQKKGILVLGGDREIGSDFFAQ